MYVVAKAVIQVATNATKADGQMPNWKDVNLHKWNDDRNHKKVENVFEANC
jgi:hypothetical protein